MSHSVAKPKTAETGVVSVVIGPTSQGDNNFTVSVASASLGFSVQVADITADDDITAVYTHNQMTRGTFQVQGYALGDTRLVGISNLQNELNGRPATGATSPTATIDGQKYDIRFNWASGHSIYGIAIIEQIQMSYSRSSPYVGVTFAGRFTSTDFSKALVVG
mgnify:CR=1 FL=1